MTKCGPCALEGTDSASVVGQLSMTHGSVAEVYMCARHAKTFWDFLLGAFASVAVIDGEE